MITLVLLATLNAFAQAPSCTIPSGIVQTDSKSDASKQSLVTTVQPTDDCKYVKVYKVKPLDNKPIPAPSNIECVSGKYDDAINKPVLIECLMVPVFSDAAVAKYSIPPFAYIDGQGRMVIKHTVSDKLVSELYFATKTGVVGSTLTGQNANIELTDLADAQKELFGGDSGDSRHKGSLVKAK